MRLLLLCQSRAGYRNLCELLTRAYRSNQYRGRAELKREWFAAPAGEGLIALTNRSRASAGLSALRVDSDLTAIALAGALNADLIVMGAYAHSRLRDPAGRDR